MLVKCRSCGNKLERKEAFKIVVGGKNLYYCNEREYKKKIEEQEMKDNIYLCINSIFGYKVINTILFKELGVLHENFPDKIILLYLQENQEFLTEIMKKGFTSEYAKIRYFSAILKNNLADFKPQLPKTPQIVESNIEVTDSKYKRKSKRRSLCEIEMEVGDES